MFIYNKANKERKVLLASKSWLGLGKKDLGSAFPTLAASALMAGKASAG